MGGFGGGGGPMRRMTQRETSGDKRRFDNKKVDVKSLLLRLWKYMGRNRLLVIIENSIADQISLDQRHIEDIDTVIIVDIADKGGR